MKLIADMIASAFRTSWKIMFVTAFFLSLAFNASTAAVGLTYSVLFSVIEGVTGVPHAGSVRAQREDLAKTKSKNVNLEADLDAAKATAVKVEERSADLGTRLQKADDEIGQLKRQVDTKTKTIADLEGQVDTKSKTIADLEGRLKPQEVTYRGKKRLLGEAVEETTQRVTRRTAAGATRNVAATFGEAIPVIGVGVVVAATAWELKDACDTMKDLHELEVALDPAKANDASVQEVCGLRVPSKEELWDLVKSSPGAAWQKAKDTMPELPEMPSIDWKFWD